MTYRHEALSVTIVTGHEDPASGTTVDWEALARVGGTIVVLMGAGRAAEIATRLVAGGLPPDTPAAAVRWATYAHQHVERLTLAGLRTTPIELALGHRDRAPSPLADLGWTRHLRSAVGRDVTRGRRHRTRNGRDPWAPAVGRSARSVGLSGPAAPR